jgi:hypothetical protein
MEEAGGGTREPGAWSWRLLEDDESRRDEWRRMETTVDSGVRTVDKFRPVSTCLAVSTLDSSRLSTQSPCRPSGRSTQVEAGPGRSSHCRAFDANRGICIEARPWSYIHRACRAGRETERGAACIEVPGNLCNLYGEGERRFAASP